MSCAVNQVEEPLRALILGLQVRNGGFFIACRVQLTEDTNCCFHLGDEKEVVIRLNSYFNCQGGCRGRSAGCICARTAKLNHDAKTSYRADSGSNEKQGGGV